MSKTSGLSLIELVIVLAVMSIIAAVGYPLYTAHIQKAKRNDAQGVLMSLANQLEQHRAAQPNVGYTGFQINNFSELWGSTAASYVYSVTLSSIAPFTYTLSANPKDAQAGDDCGDMTIAHTGTKVAEEANCWR